LVPGSAWAARQVATVLREPAGSTSASPSSAGGGARVGPGSRVGRLAGRSGGRPGRGRSARPPSPSRARRRRQAITVGREMPSRSPILVLETPSAASRRILAPPGQHGRVLAGPANWRRAARSSGATVRGAAIGTARTLSVHQLSNHVRTSH
jgi:hypothetical protein